MVQHSKAKSPDELICVILQDVAAFQPECDASKTVRQPRLPPLHCHRRYHSANGPKLERIVNVRQIVKFLYSYTIVFVEKNIICRAGEEHDQNRHSPPDTRNVVHSVEQACVRRL